MQDNSQDHRSACSAGFARTCTCKKYLKKSVSKNMGQKIFIKLYEWLWK